LINLLKNPSVVMEGKKIGRDQFALFGGELYCCISVVSAKFLWNQAEEIVGTQVFV
jgi:hypothetical protein